MSEEGKVTLLSVHDPTMMKGRFAKPPRNSFHLLPIKLMVNGQVNPLTSFENISLNALIPQITLKNKTELNIIILQLLLSDTHFLWRQRKYFPASFIENEVFN